MLNNNINLQEGINKILKLLKSSISNIEKESNSIFEIINDKKESIDQAEKNESFNLDNKISIYDKNNIPISNIVSRINTARIDYIQENIQIKSRKLLNSIHQQKIQNTSEINLFNNTSEKQNYQIYSNNLKKQKSTYSYNFDKYQDQIYSKSNKRQNYYQNQKYKDQLNFRRISKNSTMNGKIKKKDSNQINNRSNSNASLILTNQVKHIRKSNRIPHNKKVSNNNSKNDNSILNTNVESNVYTLEDEMCKGLEESSVPSLIITFEDVILQANQLFQQRLQNENNISLRSKFREQIENDQRNEQVEKLYEVIKSKRTGNDKNLDFIYLQLLNKGITQDMKVTFKPFDEKHLIVIQLVEEIIEENYPFQVVDPRNIFYLFWSLITILSLIYILWQISFEIGFSSIYNSNEPIIFWMENIITIQFTFDIILNFCLAQEDEVNNYVFDIQMIMQNQITSVWFYFDLISTIPFDLFLSNIPLNTQSFKLIRFIKLLKIVRISKAMKFKNLNVLFKSEIGIEIIQYIKQNLGQFEIFKSMISLIVVSHFQTCINFQIKTSLIENESLDWIMNYQNQDYDSKSPFQIQVKLLSENLKTALGLSVTNPSNDFEISLQIIWMIIGLSLFGYGIGSISSVISSMNKRDLEYTNISTFFKDLFNDNNCDDSYIMDKINKEIEIQFQNQTINNFESMSRILSSETKAQIELKMHDSFIKSFNLFERLNFDVIKKLRHSNLSNKTIMYKEGITINSIFFLIKGRVVESENFKIIKENETGEIIGLNQFMKYIQWKQGLNLEQLLNNESSTEDSTDIALESLINNVISKSIKNSTQENQMVQKSQAIASNDSEYLEVSFQSMEDILRQHLDSFKKIYHHVKERNEEITSDDLQENDKIIEDFNRDLRPGLLLDIHGEIVLTNETLETTIKLLSQNRIDTSKIKIAYFEKVLNDETNDNKLIYNNRQQDIKIQSKKSVKLIRYNEQMTFSKLKRSKKTFIFLQIDLDSEVLEIANEI